VRALIAGIAVHVLVFIPLSARAVADEVPSGASPAKLVDAYEIFRNARERFSAGNISGQVRFSIRVSALSGTNPVSSVYDGMYDAHDDRHQIERFSREEAAQPFVPHGINIDVTFTAQGVTRTAKRLNSQKAPTDLIGFPDLSPRYSFGIANDRNSRPQKKTDAHGAAAGAAPPSFVIGRTASRPRDYKISVAGIESQGRSTYHLSLEPLHDPKKLRLRDMWVDTETFETRKATIDGNFTKKSTAAVYWTVEMVSVDGTEFIGSEHAESVVRSNDGRALRELTIAFNYVSASVLQTFSRPLFLLPKDDKALTESM
jgi:hypothetical protein